MRTSNLGARLAAWLGRAALAIALVTLKYWAFAPEQFRQLMRLLR